MDMLEAIMIVVVVCWTVLSTALVSKTTVSVMRSILEQTALKVGTNTPLIYDQRV